MLNNKEAPINKLLTKIKAVAKTGEGMTLSSEEVGLLGEHVVDLFFIPVYDMDNIPLPSDTMSRKPKEWKPL